MAKKDEKKMTAEEYHKSLALEFEKEFLENGLEPEVAEKAAKITADLLLAADSE